MRVGHQTVRDAAGSEQQRGHEEGAVVETYLSRLDLELNGALACMAVGL